MKTVFLLLLALIPVLALAGPNDPIDAARYAAPIKVACVGASITQGNGTTPGMSYPSQLQALLGTKWHVQNFGVAGRTMLKKGDHPYWNEQAFQDAQTYQPDVVIILLGSNDTKPHNWVHHDEFPADCRAFVETFLRLASKPRVYLCLLPPVPEPGNYGIHEKNLDIENRLIAQVAAEEKIGLIDMHAPLVGHPELEPDHVHPNNAGAAILASTAAGALTGRMLFPLAP